MKYYLLLLLSIITLSVKGQIILPKGFKCSLKQNERTFHSQYLSNGKISFFSYTWGHEGLDAKETREFIEQTYGIKLSKTKDGLFWGTAPNFYVIIDNVMEYRVESTVNDKTFKYYSSWLLNYIRKNKSTGKANTFVTYDGKDCFRNVILE